MKLKSPLPKYSYLPFFTMLCLHLCTYYGTQRLTAGMEHHSVTLPIDGYIPFLPSWIYVYVLAFGFWLVCALLFMRERRDICYEVFSCIFVAELVCFVFYVLYPTVTVRPALPDDGGLAVWIIGRIYAIDEPTNLFPSMHCMISWMFAREFRYCERVAKPWRVFAFVMAVLICLSTQFVKQHVFIDLVAAILLGEVCLFLSHRFRLGRVFMLRRG